MTLQEAAKYALTCDYVMWNGYILSKNDVELRKIDCFCVDGVEIGVYR